MRLVFAAAMVTTFLASSVATADVIVQQERRTGGAQNGEGGLTSTQDNRNPPLAPNSRSADDFTLPGTAPSWTNFTFVFQVAFQTFSSPFSDVRFELRNDNGGVPADDPFFEIMDYDSFVNTGDFLLGTFPIYELTFTAPSLSLPGSGTFWASPVGYPDSQGQIQMFWPAAPYENGEQGHFRGADFGFPAWTPYSLVDADGFTADFTMTITADPVPAPGAIALLGLAGLASRRRRRA